MIRFAALFLAFLWTLPAACSDEGTGAAAPRAQEDPITEAKRLLAEAGYPDGKDFPKVELLYNTNEAHKKIAAFAQEMWRKNLGIEVELRNTEWKVYLDQLTRLDYQIARRGWVGDYPDPNTFLDMFLSKSGNNNTGWSNAEYDRIIEEAARTKDPKTRMEVLQKAERILMDEMPVIPIYFYVTQCMWRANLHGMFDNVMNTHPLKEVVHEDGDKIFVMNVGAEPQTLDPNLERGVPEHRINLALFEGLTVEHPRTLEPQPGVAESWTVSEDGKTWTFQLRDCKWTNGRNVTAHDFVYGWRRQIDPALASDYAYIVFTYLKNGKAYYDAASAGKKDVTVEQVGVRAGDDRTLVVELESPTPFFLHLTSFPSYFPVPREAVEKHGDRWTRPENIVTNGPFVMKEWVSNSHILVERNPGYWDAAKVRQKQIKFLPIDNVNTAFNMFKAGQCDWVDTVPLEFVDALRGTPEFHSLPYLSTYFYSVVVTKKPFDDKRVRRALALALKREILVEKIMRGGQKPAYHMVPPSLEGYVGQPFFRK